jgi:hypothetical protein
MLRKTTNSSRVSGEIEPEWVGIKPLEYLWTGSRDIVTACANIQFEEARRFIGERCFRRIMLMTLTFLRLNPLSSFFPQNGHWDLPSSAAIARCVAETYLRMFYFAVENVEKAEGDFRALRSQYHAQFQQLEIHSDSQMPAKLLAPLREMCDKARSALEQNGHFQNLPEKWKRTIIENPSRIDLPKISERAGISPGFHHSSYEFCSSFVHGSLYARQLTESINLQTGQGVEYFNQLTDTLCGYVALAIRDIGQLFPELPPLNPRLVMFGQIWSMIVKWENILGFDRIRRLAHQLEYPDEPEI